MKRRAAPIIIFILAINFFFVSVTVYSFSQAGQQAEAAGLPQPEPVTPVASPISFNQPNRQPAASGGGEWQPVSDHLSAAERVQIEKEIERNRRELTAARILPQQHEPAAEVTLAWPLQAADTITDYGYHGTSNFVDQDPAFPNDLLDFACGDRTYDTYNGYNHPGTDIFSWPFPWSRMDNDEIEVIAAAPGIIINKKDGSYDRNCDFSTLPWNAVYVQHADGAIAWYGHLKNGSLTGKEIGEAVSAGEYLGIVGSSGSSTAPHLHFELQDAFNQTLDPYGGTCNLLNQGSLWQEQPAYYDTAVNKITTGTAAPVITQCSTPEQPNIADEFDPGDKIYFTTYYRDQLGSTPSDYAIIAPDGEVVQSWTHAIPSSHYAASWWWWAFEFEPDDPQGYWDFRVAVAGQIYSHTFLIGTPPPPAPIEPAAEITITAPNGGEHLLPGTTLTVSWQTILTSGLAIDLYQNGILSRALTTTLPLSGAGSLTWTAPISLPTANIYRVRATSLVDETEYDESDGNFIIGLLAEYLFLPAVNEGMSSD